MFIKCPNCRQQVSTMAGTCPHCSTHISGHLRPCPKCSSHCLDTQQECPECGEHLEPLPQPEPIVTETPEPDKPAKKPHRPKAPLFIGIAIVLILGIGAGYVFYEKHLLAQEETAYEKLAEVTNPDFYQDFLNQYPDSKHYDEISDRMLQLQKEQEAWQQLMANPMRDSIQLFMEMHPNSLRMRTCEDMIDSIDWHQAQASGTLEDINNYLENHPAGQFASEAAELKNNLMLTKITPNDKAMLRGTLESFFTMGLAKRDTTAISNAIPGTMKDFCGIAGADATSIAKYAEEKMTKDALGQHYLIGQEIDIKKELLPDGEIGFAVAFNLQETVSNVDPTKNTTNAYRVTALLNQEQKIIRMTISK